MPLPGPRFSLVGVAGSDERDLATGRVEVITVADDSAAALNAGIERATGEWLALPDSPELGGDLDAFDAFLQAHPDVAMVAANRVGTHVGEVCDLDASADVLLEPGRTLVRRRTVHELGLRVDERIGPTFARSHFLATYLLRLNRPRVGIAAGAGARTADPIGDADLGDPRRYTAVLRYGYLDLLARPAQPVWVQNLVLAELSTYFWGEQVAHRQSVATDEVMAEFRALLGETARRLDDDVITGFDLCRFDAMWRAILLHGFDTAPWHASEAVVDKIDPRQDAMRVAYLFTGERPAETFRVDRIETVPQHAKVRSAPYFRHVFVHERIAWLPRGELDLELDGQAAAVRTDHAPSAPRRRRRGVPSPRRILAGARRRAVLRLAATRPVRRLCRDAWVLIDRVHDADDSAEHLFAWLRRRRRTTNAWFVIEAGTPDHRRLRRQHRLRVVPYGSLRWTLLMINCDQLVSSHADAAITDPPALRSLVRRPWRFVFLQHGVTKDDLSTWLNPKSIDVFVTSTPGEYHSVVDDGTAYRYTTKEAVLTGLPRFDVLRAAALERGSAGRDLLLVAPTWRSWLSPRGSADSQRRGTDAQRLRASDFAQNWRAVLTDPRLARAADEHGVSLALLLHPNLQAVVDALELPASIARLGFAGVRHTFARARLLVTDYSSMAFNAAYLDRPVVYFQFDRELVLGGGHVGRRGYFDYERDGFGPLTRTSDEAVAAIVGALDAGTDPALMYRERIAAAFPHRDGRCCERTADAIRDSVLPVSRNH